MTLPYLVLLAGLVVLEWHRANVRAADAVRERDQCKAEAVRLRIAVADSVRCIVVMRVAHDGYVRSTSSLVAEVAHSRAGRESCDAAAGFDAAFREAADLAERHTA